MNTLDVTKQVGSSIKSALMEYAEFQEDYENAFDQERPERMEELYEDMSPEESLEFLENQVRYIGEAFRASEDEELQEIEESIREYVGGGAKGRVFSLLANEEEYETAAKLFGLEEEQLKDDIKPQIDRYHQTWTERYGEPLKNNEPLEEMTGKIDQIAELVNPVTSAYQESSDIVEFHENIEEHLETEIPDTEPINVKPLIDKMDENED